MVDFIASPERLIFGAILGFAVLLFLIIKVKIQPFVAIMSSALIIGLACGMPFKMITSTLAQGVGTTLETIAILIGLGSMFGAILQVSGGVEVIASTLLDKFGEEKAPWALGITGLVVGMPVFFDSGLLILIPVAFGIARRTGKSIFHYSIPLLAGLAIGHAFVPPTPGPVLVAEMLGVELSYVIILGIVVGVPAMIIAGPIFGRIAGNKFICPVPHSFLENEKKMEEKKIENRKLPSFGLVVSIILLPLFLIIFNTISGLVPALRTLEPILEFLGTPVIALLLSTICGMYFLGIRGGFSIKDITEIMQDSLQSCGNIILLISGGGMLRFVLQNSGIGIVLGNFVGGLPLPLVLVAFLVAAAVRISVGSATVSMTMAAGIMASMPMVRDLSQLQLATLVIAVASGATAFSHVNDSGFWLSKSLFEVDEKTNLSTWTVMETLVGIVGIVGATIVWFIVS
ncbi:GntP family permease [Fusobacterium mortiferum]|uniref:Gluconate permease n=1 Tax=Fusobacterium mortiferum TaxID=850 RepID=A0ABS2G1Y4_FUSMR|nr:gluconate:H+ symporter [Fusobacterium mortiferum]MBM6874847.1 gluconate permease [Fusobacterium mortiferum]